MITNSKGVKAIVELGIAVGGASVVDGDVAAGLAGVGDSGTEGAQAIVRSAVGEDVFIYSLGRVSIGSEVSISYRAHICAGSHDFNDPSLPLLKPPVVIRDKAWIGTEAFIGPGVTVGAGALVGARAVVVKDVAALHVVGGNPARTIGLRPTRESG